ncbi:zinc ABC transporter permease AztB [Nocardia caishijiensis]|uniref:ABC-type Mn2+/Zn2+ transport system permease subunit n=1 Tax=Nocardia caishijiensis TaxID=184756 RepID=A0ABQ6YJ87_9NOCA|nr:zinc ABC transporter permease AztB [Nocardia caishijiensis]KAF0845703.1 ABC-type Mn2+/Zn2+ transport system permease subunit [Nocardia caishijiensis]
MEWLIAPFEVAFVQRALWGGLLVSCVCALAGTWVVVRGMAFLGDAMAHGMLPGVAVAALLGGNLIVGAAISCTAMAFGVSVLSRSKRFAADTAIGLLFVGMLAAGVIIVSRSQSFAVDLTGFLFGDVLAVRTVDLWYLGAAVGLALVVAVLGHRAFVALTFDPRKAHTLGLHPKAAHVALVGLVTLAIVASFHVVGTLLVFGLLIAPPAAAVYWSDRIPVVMALAALVGGFSTAAGLVVSWHAGTAAGATIAAVAVGSFFVSAIVSALRERFGKVGVAALAAVTVAGCGTGTEPATVEETPHGYVAGAEEMSEAQTRLVVTDPATGAVRVIDLLSEQVTSLAGRQNSAAPQNSGLVGDGRFGFLSDGGSVRVVDSGGWTVDHSDHRHYYSAPVREVGNIAAPGGVVAAYGDPAVSSVVLDTGASLVFDRVALGDGQVREPHRIEGIALPYGEKLVVADGAGRVDVRGRDGAVGASLGETCAQPRGQAVTRRGVVFGCADGAVVVALRDGAFVAEKIADPAPAADRATAFTHRPGSTTLTALAGRTGVWTLDIRKKTWKHTPIADAVAVNTAGEGSSLLVLTRDGVLHGLDPETGTETARLALTGPVEGAPVIQVDPNRAYINDIRGRTVHEIAYNDNLRIARTFPLDVAPALLVETGL